MEGRWQGANAWLFKQMLEGVVRPTRSGSGAKVVRQLVRELPELAVRGQATSVSERPTRSEKASKSGDASITGFDWFTGGGRIQDVLISRAVRDGFTPTPFGQAAGGAIEPNLSEDAPDELVVEVEDRRAEAEPPSISTPIRRSFRRLNSIQR